MTTILTKSSVPPIQKLDKPVATTFVRLPKHLPQPHHPKVKKMTFPKKMRWITIKTWKRLMQNIRLTQPSGMRNSTGKNAMRRKKFYLPKKKKKYKWLKPR